MVKIYTIILVIIHIEVTSSWKRTRFKTAQRNAAYDNVYKTDNELWVTQTRSASLCILSCLDHIDCRSVSFNNNDGRCQVYNRDFRNQVISGVSETGWKHYDFSPVNLCEGGIVSTTASDCSQVQTKGHTCTGIYTIQLSPSVYVNVYCELHTDAGGWTVFQKRLDGSVDFHLYWSDYKNGFGNPATEYWIGNDALFSLTQSGTNELLILMEDWNGVWKHARYSDFRINDETDKYRLVLSGFSGTTGNSLSYQNGQQFSTRDSDNDGFNGNCNQQYHPGGWWFKNCGSSDLNGQYYSSGVNAVNSCHWYSFSKGRISLKTIIMMVRKV